MWPSLPSSLRVKLQSLPSTYRPVADRSNSRLNPRCHDRPFRLDPLSLHFPWKYAILAGKPIQEYTVETARAFLAPATPIVPDWSFPSLPIQWGNAWRLANDTPVTSAAMSDVLLFMHRRAWLAQKTRGSAPDHLPLRSSTMEPAWSDTPLGTDAHDTLGERLSSSDDEAPSTGPSAASASDNRSLSSSSWRAHRANVEDDRPRPHGVGPGLACRSVRDSWCAWFCRMPDHFGSNLVGFFARPATSPGQQSSASSHLARHSASFAGYQHATRLSKAVGSLAQLRDSLPDVLVFQRYRLWIASGV